MADIEFELMYLNPPVGGATSKIINAETLTLCVAKTGRPREPGTDLDIETVIASAPARVEAVTIVYQLKDPGDDYVFIDGCEQCDGPHDGDVTNYYGSGPNATQVFTVPPDPEDPPYCWLMDDIGPVAVRVQIKVKRKPPPNVVDLASAPIVPTSAAPGMIVGAIVPYAGAVDTKAQRDALARAGWIPCDGAALERSKFPQLYAVIGTVYGGVGSKDMFCVPDLRGEFVRGLDLDRALDPGRTLGSVQQQSETHTHGRQMSRVVSSLGQPNERTRLLFTTGTRDTGQELRPRNIALNYLIRADEGESA